MSWVSRLNGLLSRARLITFDFRVALNCVPNKLHSLADADADAANSKCCQSGKTTTRLKILSRLLIVANSPQQSGIDMCLGLRVLPAGWLAAAPEAEEGAALDDGCVDAGWGDLLLGGLELLEGAHQGQRLAIVLAFDGAGGGAARVGRCPWGLYVVVINDVCEGGHV